jgi:hypothetical protein
MAASRWVVEASAVSRRTMRAKASMPRRISLCVSRRASMVRSWAVVTAAAISSRAMVRRVSASSRVRGVWLAPFLSLSQWLDGV